MLLFVLIINIATQSLTFFLLFYSFLYITVVKAYNSWWRSSNYSANLTQCFEHAACLGAANPNRNVNLEKNVAEIENNETCASGYKGRLCHRCDKGYGRETFDSCMLCPPQESNTALMGLGIVAVILMLVVFVIFTVRTGNEEETTASMMFKTLAAYGQVVGIASLFPYRWPKSVLTLFDMLEMMTSVSDRFLNTDCALNDENRSIPLTYEKAILYMTGPLGFVLGATLFWMAVHGTMTCRWKHREAAVRKKSKRTPSRSVEMTTLNIRTVQKPYVSNPMTKNMSQVPEQKVNGMNSKKKSRVESCNGSELLTGTKKRRNNLIGLGKRNNEPAEVMDWRWSHTKRYLVVSIIITMVILHPTLTRQSLFLFMCTQIEGKYYLRKDVQLECFTPQHFMFAFSVGLPGIILYVIGTPGISFWLLYKRRHKLTVTGIAGQETRQTYGFLYRGYRIFYWEIIIMSRKISMVIVAVFGLQASVETQALLALLIIVLAFAAHVMLKPFSLKFAVLDRLERFGLVTAFITLYFGMFFFTKDVETNESWLGFVTMVILGSNFIFITYWLITLYRALRNEINSVRRCDTRCRLSCSKLKSYLLFRMKVSSCYRRCVHVQILFCCKKKKASPQLSRNRKKITYGRQSILWTASNAKSTKKTSKFLKRSGSGKVKKHALELAPIPTPKAFKERQLKLAQSTLHADQQFKLRTKRAIHLDTNGQLRPNSFSEKSAIGNRLIKLSLRAKTKVNSSPHNTNMEMKWNSNPAMKNIPPPPLLPPPSLPPPPAFPPPPALPAPPSLHAPPSLPPLPSLPTWESNPMLNLMVHPQNVEQKEEEVRNGQLDSGWEAILDDVSGDMYYYHEKTDVTTWNFPLSHLGWEEHQRDDGTYCFYNAKKNIISDEFPKKMIDGQIGKSQGRKFSQFKFASAITKNHMNHLLKNKEHRRQNKGRRRQNKA